MPCSEAQPQVYPLTAFCGRFHAASIPYKPDDRKGPGG